MLRLILKILALFAVAIFLGVYFHETIASFKYEQFKDVMTTLMSLSSIIFAIIGAWVAIIYPKTITRVFVGNSASPTAIEEAEEDARYLSSLVLVIVVSAFILISILMVQLAIPIYMSIPELFKFAGTVKVIGVIFIGILTLLQLLVFFRVLALNYKLLSDVRRGISNGRTDRNHR